MPSYTAVDQEASTPSHAQPSDDEGSVNEHFLRTFGSDSEDDADWMDDRQPPPASTAGTSNATPTEESERRGWSNIFARLYKKKVESGHSDGVFNNLTVKSEGQEVHTGEDELDEEPPTYDEAAADATPSYWETTIMTSDWSSEVLVGDMPVGSPMHFAWNMLISATFNFVGFIITYLFHTTHAARAGSIAGFGCTLIQSSYSFDISEPSPSPPADEFTPDDPNSFDGTPSGGTFHAPQGYQADVPADGDGRTTWISRIVFVMGCIMVIRGLAEYIHAQVIKKRIMRYNNSNSSNDESEEAEDMDVDTPGINDSNEPAAMHRPTESV